MKNFISALLNKSAFLNNMCEKLGPTKTILVSGVSCIAVASIITTSAFAAISYNNEKKKEVSQVAERSTFEAAFPMAAWNVEGPTPIPLPTTAETPTPTETPTPSPDPSEEEAAREAAKKSPEAAVSPKTGSVLTSSEYKYDPSKDSQPKNRNENVDNSSANTIVSISSPSPTANAAPQKTPSPTSVATPQQKPSPKADTAPSKTPSPTSPTKAEKTPSPASPTAKEETPSVETTPTAADVPTNTPSPTQAVYADGWNIINGKTYYCMNNSFLKGWADIGGFRYYFSKKTGIKSSRVGIDVSYFQGNIDWNKVKAAGVDFAIIRAGGRYYGGGGLYVDDNFEKNIKGALAAGIKCGVYVFSAAINEVEGAQEANLILNAIQGYNITGPLVIDLEVNYGRAQNLTKSQRTNIALTALEVLKSSGHNAMLYTGHYFYQNYLEPSRLTGYPLWIAYYTSDYNKVSDVPYSIWQYTSSGSVPGISGRVDLNVWK